MNAFEEKVAQALEAHGKPSVGFAAFIQAQGAALRANDLLPATLDEWKQQKATLRDRLLGSWGNILGDPCPLEPQILGELKRDGYRVEKIVLQTRPGIRMTANAYVPDGGGKRPAVLGVHGHWRGAKQDPVVQARCIGLAKLGFFVLAVDAFGAGERALGEALGEYHGEMVAATLFPTGLTLAGLQVCDNMRAVDYLQSRPEVDAEHIGITGASGGGNQSMYAGAFDERFGCVVPTCSVGTYQSYLTAACCMCELVPSAITYTEEWGILALTAPRTLMVINATQDAFQFSVDEAKKSLARTQRIFDLFGSPGSLKHAVFESKHDYNQPMREAMYGWMTLHLKGEGDGLPIADPTIALEDPETLRCYPGESRPQMFMTLPQFAAEEGRTILRRRRPNDPRTRERWDIDRQLMIKALSQRVLGGFPDRTELNLKVADDPATHMRSFKFEPEPGLTLDAQHVLTTHSKNKLAILLHLEGREKALGHPLFAELQQAGWLVVTLDLRATGALAVPNDAILNAPDHNTAQWSIWVGRPLLGQWVWDVRRLLDALESETGRPKRTALVGIGSAGIVALCAAALDDRITHVAAVESLASYVSSEPYRNQRFGIVAPGILAHVGDVAHLAALAAPRRLVVAGAVHGNGKALTAPDLSVRFEFTQGVYGLHGATEKLTVQADSAAKPIVELLNV